MEPDRGACDFRRLFESLPGAYLVLDPAYCIVAASDEYLRATRTTRDVVIGRGIFDVFPDNPDDPAATGVRQLRASLDRVVLDGVRDAMAVQHYDIPRPEAEGGGFEERHWSPVNAPVFRADGPLGWIIHRVEDVTEFVRLRRHDAEQEQLALALQQRGAEMEAEIFRRAQEIQATNAALRQAKAALEELVATRTAELADANNALQHEMQQTLALAEQVRQAQKLEALGRLAGGIAHDFNNLLTVIMSYSEVLIHSMAHDDPDREDLVEIGRAAERAAALTRQLLAFSRQQVLEPQILDLKDVVSRTEAMLRRLIGEDLRLALSLTGPPAMVRADPGQLEQVVMNLAVNARDAMPLGGQLTIEVTTVELDAGYTQYHVDVEAGTYAMVAVSDTGIGMDPATQARIFEPFFTTKPVGTGTGLGLSTVFGIVKQSGGHIYVYSEPGQGSTFKIYLPSVDAPAATAAAGPADRPEGRETILLVEDDTAVRTVTRRALERLGYTVLDANGGDAALQLAESHEGPIDLLMSDVVMPGLGGRALSEAILAIRPETRVLFLSGYTDDAVVRHGILRAEVAFLQKPFTQDGLARKVRDALQNRAGAAEGAVT
jgi:signal transduction histidine kinase/ActR/RegA family two-component response regulator